MIRGANALSIPVVVTEQYPERFGATARELSALLKPTCKAIPKTTFSMVVPEVAEVLASHPTRRTVLLTGIEAQVCVFQTALDLIGRGYEVHVLADGVSSSRAFDCSVGLWRMTQHGALVSCYEMALLELMRDSRAPNFKVISELLKKPRPERLPSLPLAPPQSKL
eukprot:CAMPEP_0118933732 /NCGR_PEP_ID=MMETSP1169-20130426/12308_1 /TAXON_ID=36882 /ORGANISM="Pyramimonas obovata, Strain CCMP722" /LENGTH=165 /DNA_ID=CAMNT_0006876539 /DNA_START=321 /DNA_END=818 /DNA_ORIENTATION=+